MVNIASLAIAVLLAAGGPARTDGGPGDCESTSQELSKRLANTVIAMEPEGDYHHIRQQASEALATCRQSEALSYLLLRADELANDAEPPDSEAAAERRRSMLSLAAAFPKSVRIATIRARLEGTVEAARRATLIDQSYPPAQVALAAALLAAGDRDAALKVLEAVSDLGMTDDGFAVLAQVRLARGDLGGAIDAGKREMKGRALIRIEPGGRDRTPTIAANEALGLALAAQGRVREAAPYLLAAERHSSRVRELLKSPGPKLREALARARQPKSN